MSFLNSFGDENSDVGSLKRLYPFVAEEQPYEYNAASLTSSPSFQYTEGSLYSTTDHTLCFGSIIEVEVQLHNIDKLDRWDPFPGSAVQSFNVGMEGDYVTLEYREIRFGRLKKGLCRLLRKIMSMQRVRIRGHISTHDWHKAINTRNRVAANNLFLELSINGAREDAKEVGAIMSKSGVFLQMPHYGLEGLEYYNPHILRMEGHSEAMYSEIVPFEQPDIYTKRPRETLGEGERAGAECNDTDIVDSILDSLSHHNVLREINIVSDIRSALLPHQKEAVDFIFRRETERSSSELSLWKLNDVDADEPFYQHIFSGAKRPEPAEARGGIIADEMGLGKSLIILSTIAGSVARSQEFVYRENQQLSCEPPKRRASRGTLILAPSSLLIDSWVDEIRKHTHPGSLPFHKHLGSTRHKETELLYQRPVVFSTYATVTSEFRRGNSTLANINWFRVVLDEAHDIRNRSTGQFKAIASIPALHRWCLTGTPIQNSLEDLGSLVSFLKVPILDQAPSFRKFITNPINSTSNSRFQNLQTLLRTICLRRTRQLLNLPDPIPEVRELAFTPTEKSEYQDLLRKCKMYIDMAVSNRGKSNVNAAFLRSLLKLRLFCNNGHSRIPSTLSSKEILGDPDEALIYLEQQGRNSCVYCNATVYHINGSGACEGGKLTSSHCHVFCHNCMFQHRAKNQKCPVCTNTDESGYSLPAPSTGVWQAGAYPTKLWTLLSDIRDNPGQKRLNLAVATRIYLLEPQWNPSIESQAIGRALRFGQTAQVVITRYIMIDSIEQNNVIFRQKKKLDLAGRGFNRGKDISSERLQAVRDVFGTNTDST
ncbi:hypothetical protein NPX13_g1492 [Xylaria arbuscula]|uniref:Helicase ATP-binding domain-containing protein n=1 Tax=Xylaria arbuscula TaxID=114810 RepID=A0A9W8NMK2_9PEZI|nr:hypothetical protein NPX13_g1492 [Xylaria arbuscula]